MKLCRFNNNRLGVIEADEVLDVTAILVHLERQTWPRPPGDPLIREFAKLCDLAQQACAAACRLSLAEVKLECLITEPTKVIGAPVNYAAHVAEAEADRALSQGKAIAKIREIGLFLKANTSLAAPADGIDIRFPERRTDHELELAVVIGTQGTNISKETALQHVAGYTIGLDMTLRGKQDRSLRKSIDSYTIVGPWMVSADEIADPQNLEMQLAVNGKIRQTGSTADMTLGIAELIEFASAYYSLYPGDLLLTGTPAGVGPVVAGDVINANIEGIGELVVQVS